MVGLKYRMRNACGFFHIIIIILVLICSKNCKSAILLHSMIHKYQPEGKQDEEIDRHKISLRAVLLLMLLKGF